MSRQMNRLVCQNFSRAELAHHIFILLPSSFDASHKIQLAANASNLCNDSNCELPVFETNLNHYTGRPLVVFHGVRPQNHVFSR
jgi:hypothetical protein